MRKWEYYTTSCPIKHGPNLSTERLKWLNDLGKEGWELAAVDSNDDYRAYYYFKRQLPDENN